MKHGANMRDPRTYAIIGAAMAVHKELGPGFLEAVYQDAMAVALGERGGDFRGQVCLPVTFHGNRLGAPYRADFVCYGEVLVELKASALLHDADDRQVVHYLKASGLRTGLLLNFGASSLEWRRFIHDPAYAGMPRVARNDDLLDAA